MGITGRVTMPFLSTLAALVIIVHSTEEDTQSDYRRDLRPRVLDTGTPTYEQPWRVMNEESMIQKSTQGDTWNDNSSEEPPKRRRPGRKRKRRPQSSLNEDQSPQDRYGYPEEPLRPYFDEEMPNARQTTETVKRRRRKPEGKPLEWVAGPLEIERPLRRRGQRRKRPSLEPWPQLSEFDEYNSEKTTKGITTETKTPLNTYDNTHQDNENQNENPMSITANDNGELTEQKPLIEETDFPLGPEEKDFEFLINKPELQEDKSLSEFSIEVMTQAHESSVEEEPTRLQAKLGDKTSGVLNEHDKAKENGPIDPVSLKDILKRSNGSSLSEILQQHNLSLADLLRGKQNAISIFQSDNTFEYRRKPIADTFDESGKAVEEINTDESYTGYRERHDNSRTKENELSYSITNQTIDLIPQNTNGQLSSFIQNRNEVVKKDEDIDITTTTEKQETVTPKVMSRIRFPTGLRKKLRMRPMMNTTYKAQLSRDLIALNARRYIHHRKNNTKSREWKNMLPSLTNKTTQQPEKKPIDDIETENHIIEETTTAENGGFYSNSTFSNHSNIEPQADNKSLNEDVTTEAYTTTKVVVKEIFKNAVGEQPTVLLLRQPGEIAGNRRKPFNNRKKKRIRQKSSTTEPAPENLNNNGYGSNDYAHLEIIPRPRKPEISEDSEGFPTNLEDFMTTRSSVTQMDIIRPAKISAKIFSTITHPTTQSSMEETAKIEIDEILNDTGASARLSKILMERNMTLTELVEHRERGSSHVHLADIFHNASKEPNPPEPFLSKSLIEPISKETYPLRAILEANLHDASVKATTIDPSMVENNNYLNIPVVMDFGNNVNENAENMGIMSLFSNFTRLSVNTNHKEGTTTHTIIPPEKSEVVTTVTTQLNNSSTNLRESRVLPPDAANDNQDDVASWKAIFSLMKDNYKNQSKDLLENLNEEFSTSDSIKTITLEDDVDGNGVVVLEDLKHLKDFDNNIASESDDRLEFNPMERSEATSGILEIIPSQTKSVTVATASIAGLAIVLFLLTYAAFKWKQQKGIGGIKHNYPEERLPAPVFENRKSHKNNSSTRSISPMLSSTSNIYTLNTLDSRNGKESPEYMWDTLRKPFQ
ncbi:uncharacterized protein LOC115443553 isoform X2 [Manduca sexta]|uniref:uncharacterized protein LOC115443553 isoform X2 n=1 Tax=Manduca sexta TaxID=7130 RepID=UPI00188EE2A1|nr:uncharacterized protein LOC115443553 isoform X2 [Manduca sexta]